MGWWVSGEDVVFLVVPSLQAEAKTAYFKSSALSEKCDLLLQNHILENLFIANTRLLC